MATDRAQALADALNNISRANLHDMAAEVQWQNLVDEYFLYEEEVEEGLGDKEEVEEVEEQSEEEEEPLGDVVDSLVVTDPTEEILQDEWVHCENLR